MDARIIQSEEEFRALEASWNALADRCPARPFQEFGWALAWLSTIGAARDYQPRVVTLWEGPVLLALMPLALRRYKGARFMEWIGAKVSDYCDVLIDPCMDRGLALRSFEEALNLTGDFDVLRLGQVRSDAAANELFRGVRAWTASVEDSWCVPLRWTSGEEWLRDQSASRRAEVRRGLRRAERMGFEFRIWASPEPHAPWVEAVIEKKLAWISSRGLQSPLLSGDVRDFIRAAAAYLAPRGMLHLSAVRSSTEIAACHLDFYHHGILYQYLSAFDPAFSRHGLGTTLLDSLIMWACDHGARHFDLLLGSYEYKMHYRPVRECVRTRLIGRRWAGKALVSLYRLAATHRRGAVGAKARGD